MRILFIGDIVGESGRKVVNQNLARIRDQYKLDFVIANGENSASGFGITEKIFHSLIDAGVDVITSGNHIWDKDETANYIEKEKRLLRPANLAQGSPGQGFGIYLTKDKKYKIGVINLMGNVFMKKTEDVFKVAKDISNKIKLKILLPRFPRML